MRRVMRWPIFGAVGEKNVRLGGELGPDGALYITDDAGGRIYRITSAGGAGAQ